MGVSVENCDRLMDDARLWEGDTTRDACGSSRISTMDADQGDG